ncbi:MAG: amidohydrolase family protein [Candidatus Synoicihabitans palmerolidicus]|nr:amidohydrolase family protein [Candidatus Synoicihabitans palmerolidicus]
MSLRYIDTHVHFWDRSILPYGGLEPFEAISTPHTPATYQTETAVAPPEKIVFLQCVGDIDRWRDEVNWIESLAAADPRLAGIVATAPLDQGDHTLHVLDALATRPLVKGIRHNTQDGPRGHAYRHAYVAGAHAAGQRGLSVDLCCLHPQLPDLTALAAHCPQTSFILDHLGKPGIRDHLIDQWHHDIDQLARQPNVTAKLSGIVTEADPATWTTNDLRPYVARYLEVFGAQRIGFGSAWPVVKLASTHAQWLTTARTLLAPLSAEDQHQIFFANAERIYRLAPN